MDKETRSRMMAAIGGKNTKPETKLRKALHGLGFRFRLHDKRLPGRPDIVLPKWKVAIAVHGCFWHRHEGCRYATTPATRWEFWQEKFASNIERDRRTAALLKDMGWRYATVWECALRGNAIGHSTEVLTDWIKKGDQAIEIFRLGLPDLE